MTGPARFHCYFGRAFEWSVEALVEHAKTALRGVEYDTMVGTGVSGAAVVPVLGRAMKKHWMLVRKPGENSHSGGLLAGDIGQRWIFVDDFISSGATLSRVQEAIAEESKSIWNKFTTEYVGTYQYTCYLDTAWTPARSAAGPDAAEPTIRLLQSVKFEPLDDPVNECAA